MGTPLAVPFACLFVAQMEQDIWNNQAQPVNQPLFYRRYIDDIFYIADTLEDANQFFQKFNSMFPTIRCGSITMDVQSGIFLDVEIFKGPRFATNGVLDFRTYQKPQNRYLYLAPNSFHRRDIFKSMILSEIHRYRLTCSNDNDFDRMRSLFYQRLIDRGYNPDYLNCIFPFHSDRATLLTKVQQRFSTVLPKQKKVTPLLFKTVNSVETSLVPLTRLLRASDEIQTSLAATNPQASAVMSTPIITCYSNASTSYKYIGNARKTLHQTR